MKNYINISKRISKFNKTIEISGDKSLSIRCVLLASQAIGTSKIYNLLESEDVISALESVKKLGIKYKKFPKYYQIKGYGLNGYNTKKKVVLNAGNSGTLARLILGLLVDSRNQVKITGDRSLSSRDFSRVTEPLKLFGANIESRNKKLPVKIFGTNFLRPISYVENIGSAQCKSAVIFASLKTPGVTIIKAKKSRNHTELLLKNLGVAIKVKKKKSFDYIEIKGQKNFKCFDYKIPGDISSCSFFLVLTLLAKNSKLTIKNVNINKTRTGIITILNKMGAQIKFKNTKNYKGELISDIHVESKSNLKGVNCPQSLNSSAIDEFLIIFLVAAKVKGISKFYNLGELNKKESSRLDIAVNFLKMIGVKVIKKQNDLKIFGNPKLKLNGVYEIKKFKKDHRVFMMSCIAALVFGGKWKINDRKSTYTSFPNFFKIIKSLGAKLN